MPNHTPEHMARLVRNSGASRRVTKLAGLIESSPMMTEQQVHKLKGMLDAKLAVKES